MFCHCPLLPAQNENCLHMSPKGLESSGNVAEPHWRAVTLQPRNWQPYTTGGGWTSSPRPKSTRGFFQPPGTIYPVSALYLQADISFFKWRNVLSSILLLAQSREFVSGKFHGGWKPAENTQRGKSETGRPWSPSTLHTVTTHSARYSAQHLQSKRGPDRVPAAPSHHLSGSLLWVQKQTHALAIIHTWPC